jgi:hypothetical protein
VMGFAPKMTHDDPPDHLAGFLRDRSSRPHQRLPWSMAAISNNNSPSSNEFKSLMVA